MKSKPLVSIITVVYNADTLIENTINNISDQTYTNKEYIVIDGNSNDNTYNIILQHKAEISIIVHEPDRGLYDAMNKGIRLAKGDYIVFMNAGDSFFSLNTLEKVFENNDNEDVFYGQAAITNRAGEIMGLRTYKKLPDNLSWRDMRLGMVVCHQSIIAKRSIVDEYNLDYKIAADIDWTIRLLKKAKTVKNTRRVISTFLEGGISSKRQKQSWRERFKILNHHFGVLVTLFSHVQIFFEAIAFKVAPKRKEPVTETY